MKPYAIIIAIVLLCFGSTPLRADVIYTWKDNDGVLHFTDTQPLPETVARASNYLEIFYEPREEPYETASEDSATDEIRQEETDADAEVVDGESGIEPGANEAETGADEPEVAEVDSENTAQPINGVGVCYKGRSGCDGYRYYHRPYKRYHKFYKKHRYYKHRRYLHRKYHPGRRYKFHYRKHYRHPHHYRMPHYYRKHRVIRPGFHRHRHHPRPTFGSGIRIKHRR